MDAGLDRPSENTRTHSHHGLRHGHNQRLVGPALRSHFTPQGVSEGSQAKAAHSPLTSAFDTQPTHNPLSKALSTPIPTFLTPPTPPAETPQPAKRARAIHYENYVPEEETIRNDYSQRYVDGGEWPQNWVLGAEPERRFEEFVHSSSCRLLISSKNQLHVCAHLSLGSPRSQHAPLPLMQRIY